MKWGVVIFLVAGFLAAGCDKHVPDPTPCQTIFDPDLFSTDQDALNYVRKLIPLGANMDCVQRVMNSNKIYVQPLDPLYPATHVFRESKWTSPDGSGLALNSRIVIVEIVNNKVSDLKVN